MSNESLGSNQRLKACLSSKQPSLINPIIIKLLQLCLFSNLVPEGFLFTKMLLDLLGKDRSDRYIEQLNEVKEKGLKFLPMQIRKTHLLYNLAV